MIPGSLDPGGGYDRGALAADVAKAAAVVAGVLGRRPAACLLASTLIVAPIALWLIL